MSSRSRALFSLAAAVFLLGASAPARSPGQPVLIHPRDGQATTVKAIRILGYAGGPGQSARMTLRGQPVPLAVGPDGVFRGEVELRPGTNALSFAGREVRVLLLEPGKKAPREFAEVRIHSPVEEGCSACHAPPSASSFALKKRGASLCSECHADPRLASDGKPYSANCAAPRGGCVSCHDPHASSEEPHLKASPRSLCLGCHRDPGLRPDGKPWPRAHGASKVSCQTCHSPHGSNVPKALRKPAVPLCRSCHTGHTRHPLDASRAAGPIPKILVWLPDGFPVEEDGTMSCLGCHQAHGGENKALLRQPFKETCPKCHPFL